MIAPICRRPRRAVLAATLLLALGACTSTPTAPIDAGAVPAAFRQPGPPFAATLSEPAPAHGQWWHVFGDPTLDQLQARAALANTGIRIAAARLTKARALLRRAEAARLPRVALAAGVGRQGGPLINAAGGEGTLVTATADVSYDVDVFGRLQRASDAAALDAAAQESLLQAARLLMQADLAQTYLELRGLDAQRALVLATTLAWRDTVAITDRRWRSGSIPELEAVRAQAELAALESEGYVLDRHRAELENAIAVLVGEPPSDFAIPVQDAAPGLAALPAIPAGLPAAVLTRRPDVAAAQHAVAAAQARLGLARDAWLPTLALTAAGGSAAPGIAQLLDASMRTWSIAALVGATLFDGGRRAAEVQNARGDLDIALAGYREQVLSALREVEDQLAALRLLDAQSRAQATAVMAGSRAAVLAQSRYRSGLASQLEVLDARRAELRSRREALQVRTAREQATVRLIRALGGGWDSASPAR